MNKTQQLHDLGQSLWLDNITRLLLDDGTLRRYIDEFSITGLTSNPTIFNRAIGNSSAYDNSIRTKAKSEQSEEALFVELALEDLRRAADLFRPVFDATDGVDGWVSMEVSPLLANDTAGSIEAAKRLHRQANRPNLFVKIPGTPEGIPAIEQAIFAGVPINVTLLFSCEQYIAAAEAYLRGIERRIAAGLRLGIAIGERTYRAYLGLFASPRWRRLAAAGAQPQRLLWASTGTKDPNASDTLYIEALSVPGTISTIPEQTLRAFAQHGLQGAITKDGGDAEAMLRRFADIGIDVDALATQLQHEGVLSFVKSWRQLIQRIIDKREAVANLDQQNG
jgi:transaldolase